MPAMKTQYVLVDYENVQPKNLGLLRDQQFRVYVFLGKNNTRLSVDLVTALHTLGPRAEYVRMEGSGPNALDFHIAYYIGRIAASDPAASFHIVSRDTGFDPLIAHLKAQGHAAKRTAALEAVPVLKPLTQATRDEQVDGVVEHLRGMAKSRPQRVKTLRAMISSWFGKSLDEAALDRIVKELVRRGVLQIEDTRVKYAAKA